MGVNPRGSRAPAQLTDERAFLLQVESSAQWLYDTALCAWNDLVLGLGVEVARLVSLALRVSI
jgi:hypothetical protein